MITMKSLAATIILSLFLCSCLKESIPEAMANKKNGPKVPASFSFKVNGIIRSYSVEDVRRQEAYPNGRFGCKKTANSYEIFGQVEIGRARFSIYTDSLTVGNYSYPTAREVAADTGYLPFYIYAPTDRISINISSHSNGYISGNFTALLTPVTDAGRIPYTYGAPSSIAITEGSFKNVPVFY